MSTATTSTQLPSTPITSTRHDINNINTTTDHENSSTTLPTTSTISTHTLTKRATIISINHHLQYLLSLYYHFRIHHRELHPQLFRSHQQHQHNH
ncbi:hypothetical protein Bca4012_092303 [Brassica carinata]